MELIDAVIRHQFLRHALYAGVLIASVNALLSVFVIQKGLSFVGAGIAHSAFGGLGLGVAMGVDPFIPGVVFSVATGFLVGAATRRGPFQVDSAIGIAFSSSMALGVLVISTSRGRFFGELFSYLFGNIMAVSGRDIRLMTLAAALVVLFVLACFRQLLLVILSEEMARTQGINTDVLHYGLLIALAVTVILSVRLVGVILASALLVIPGATAGLLCRSYRTMVPCAVAIGVLSVIVGIAISYHLDWPAGATVVLLSAAVFVAALIMSRQEPGYLIKSASNRKRE